MIKSGRLGIFLLRRSIVVILVLLCTPNLANGEPVRLTQAEQAWIRAHPIIRVTSDAQLAPLEYMKNGRLSGLSADYLKLISERSGIRFQFTQSRDWATAQAAIVDGRADMLVNAMPDRLFPATRDSVQLSRPYLVAYSVVFSKPGSPNVWTMDDLAGKRVAARSQGQYAKVLQANYPAIRVVPAPTPLDAFKMVTDGRADAAIGTTLTFMPFVTRRDSSEMYISRPQITMAMTAQFATRKDWPILHGIIEKTLSSMSTEEESALRERWLHSEDFGAPTLKTILQHNGLWVAAVVVLIVSLAIVTRWALGARRAAIESEHAKARFLATMSHEIRTPVNAIVGAIELLADQLTEGRQLELVGTAEQAAEVLADLLDNVLDLSKLNEGRMRLERVPVEARALGRSVAAVFSGDLQRRGINLQLNLPEREYWLMTDPTRLRQVLLNLLGNARKFTERGSITFAIELLEEGEVTWLHAIVSDTGCGIPEKLQAGIFEPYTQADGSISRRYGGTGLGLSISKELIDLMGGSIELHSEEGDGTTVSFRIPVDLAEEAPVLAAGNTGATIDRLRVLIVDDHAPNRLILGEQLARLGISTESADGALAALAHLQKGPSLPDIVLMDCFMPDIDGYEACQMIRSSGIVGTERLPVIAISAATDEAHLKRCTAAGMNGVLKKPIRLTELRAMLARWSGGVVSAGSEELNATLQERIETEMATDLRRLLADDVEHLLAALQSEDQAQAIFFAHRLHGAAGLVGMGSLATVAASIERDPFGDRVGAMKRLIALLEEIDATSPRG